MTFNLGKFPVFAFAIWLTSCDSGVKPDLLRNSSWKGDYGDIEYAVTIDSFQVIQIVSMETDYVGTYDLKIEQDTFFFDAGFDDEYYFLCFNPTSNSLNILPRNRFQKDIPVFCLIDFKKQSS